ncbi:hypothetical protein NEOLEDRAFT_739258 [Neolentinus lepideus HHB14362 ss-1]|uniref:Uncharacterized protein n=1 Tax=Neolentinus lepideus HHB14362 ss-1 TaxID=1314782 RepID=A0A165PVH9_9AGAM|nr:hypothetical protein NEOLEDRAFT_739258 [Neolentinus lepideus HHB14362 ss-1]
MQRFLLRLTHTKSIINADPQHVSLRHASLLFSILLVLPGHRESGIRPPRSQSRVMFYVRAISESRRSSPLFWPSKIVLARNLKKRSPIMQVFALIFFYGDRGRQSVSISEARPSSVAPFIFPGQ